MISNLKNFRELKAKRPQFYKVFLGAPIRIGATWCLTTPDVDELKSFEST